MELISRGPRALVTSRWNSPAWTTARGEAGREASFRSPLQYSLSSEVIRGLQAAEIDLVFWRIALKTAASLRLTFTPSKQASLQQVLLDDHPGWILSASFFPRNSSSSSSSSPR